MNKSKSLKSVLLEARKLALQGRYRSEWYIQSLIDDAITEVGGPGPESSREEMHPPSNGTLDCITTRVAPAQFNIMLV